MSRNEAGDLLQCTELSNEIEDVKHTFDSQLRRIHEDGRDEPNRTFLPYRRNETNVQFLI